MAVTGVNDYTSTYAATGSTNTKGSNGLSSTAQDYLNGLRQKYSDVNITVANFTSDKQMKDYMLGSSGSNNIAISSNIIEQMANDPATAAKYEKVIADVPKAGKEMVEAGEARGLDTLSCGTYIDKDGKVSYWSVVATKRDNANANTGVSNKEKLQKQLEEKRAKKKEEEAAKEKRLERAETLEKLLEKIRAGRAENEVKAKEDGKGIQVDFTI